MKAAQPSYEQLFSTSHDSVTQQDVSLKCNSTAKRSFVDRNPSSDTRPSRISAARRQHVRYSRKGSDGDDDDDDDNSDDEDDEGDDDDYVPPCQHPISDGEDEHNDKSRNIIRTDPCGSRRSSHRQRLQVQDHEEPNIVLRSCAQCHSPVARGAVLCASCRRFARTVNASCKRERKSKRGATGSLLHELKGGSLLSLQELCIRQVVRLIDYVDDFGDIVDDALDRIGTILSKQNKLNDKTARLFLKSNREHIHLYDCANLSPQTYSNAFFACHALTTLSLDFCGQLDDEVCFVLLNPKLHSSTFLLSIAPISLT